MTTQDEVEAWLKKAPKSIKIDVPIDVRENNTTVRTVGRATPQFIRAGYIGIIGFTSKEWDDE